MNELTRTGIFVVGAIALGFLAYATTPGEVEHALFDDQGELFFEDFTEPSEAASLEIMAWDEDKEDIVAFKVEQQDNGLWTIPSHHDYPADAKTQMADAASALIGLRKERVVSDVKADHARFGVVDPMSPGLESEGRGSKVTFADSGGNTLAALIVGDKVQDEIDQYYVRLPDSNRVYATTIEADISTRFEDWIERDLLSVSAWDMTRIEWDNYSIDEQRGAIVEGEDIAVTKNDQNQWQLEGLGEDEETATSKVSEVASSLASLKIVGVRKKPEGLTAALETAEGFERMALQQILREKGYFVGPEEKLYSNEGDLFVHTRKGVVYTLRFGEVVYGSSDELSSGILDEGDEGEGVGQGTGDQVGPQAPQGEAHRYLMITASFDESLLDEPEGTPLPQEELDKRTTAREKLETLRRAIQDHKDEKGGLPPDLAALTEPLEEGGEALVEEIGQDPWGNDYVYTPAEDGSAFTLRSYGADGAEGGDLANADVDVDDLARENEFQKIGNQAKEFERKKKEGQEEAEKLEQRFGQWYYVIDAESFDSLKVERVDLVKEKEPEEPADGQESAQDAAAPGDPDKGPQDAGDGR